MEVFVDPPEVKEQENSGFVSTKRRSDTCAPLSVIRTPLTDVKNKQVQKTSGLVGSSKKQDSSDYTRLDALNLQTSETPRRQHSSSKSRRSCFAAFHVAQDPEIQNDKAMSITLPKTIEEEPDTDMLHSQTLLQDDHSNICPALLHEAVQEQNIQECSAENMLLENNPGLPDKPQNSSIYKPEQIEIGNEVTVFESNSLDNEGSDHEGDAVDVAVPTNNNVGVCHENDSNSSSTQLAVISVVENETDQLVELLLQEFASEVSQDLQPLNMYRHVTKDHAYGKSVECASPAMKPEQEGTTTASATFSHELNFHKAQIMNSTPKPTASHTQVHRNTPTEQSPPFYGFEDISNSSMKETLQNAELSGMMETYLLQDSSSISDGPSLSSPSICRLLEIDLSPRVIQTGAQHATPVKPSSSNSFTLNTPVKSKVFTPDTAVIPDSPVIHIKTDVTNVGTQDELEHLSSSSCNEPDKESEVLEEQEKTNILNNASSMYSPTKDMNMENTEGSSTSYDEEIDNFPVTTSYQATSLSALIDNLHITDSLATSEKCETANVATNTSLYSFDITEKPCTETHEVKSMSTNGPHTTSVCTNTSAIAVMNVSVSTGDAVTETACMSTNTSIHQFTDVSVLTDCRQGTLVNTSMVTDACQATDVSMITDACNGVDVSMVTDNAAMLDHSMMAIPDSMNKQTMTEKKTMIDAESAMTPLKLNKQGKRLTAEEIRRQHPRTIANQLETTMATNQRLEKEVKALGGERDRLKSTLKETKAKLVSSEKQLEEVKLSQDKHIAMLEQLHEEAVKGLEKFIEEKQMKIADLMTELEHANSKCETAEVKLTKSEAEFQDQCERLEKLRLEAELHFAEELQQMRTHFEENSYERQFKASQQVISELQAEREEFLALMDDIEGATVMQFRLRDAVHLLATKVQRTAKEQAVTHGQLLMEYEQMRKKFTSMDVDLQVALSENKELQEDIQNMNDILTRSNDSLVELEEMYQETKEALLNSQAQVIQLQADVASQSQAGLSLDQAEARIKELEQELDTQKLQLTELEQELDSQKLQSEAKRAVHEKIVEEHEETKAKLELYIQNLQHTLDSWEVDRELQEQELTECHQHIANQRTKMEGMANELAALRKIKASTQAERDLLTELKNTVQFLEAEKELYLEAITDFRTRLEAETALAESNKGLIDALRSNNAELQESYEQLTSDVQALEDELSVRTMDIETSWTAMENLEERMENVLTSLQNKFGIAVTSEPAKKTPSKPKFITPRKQNSGFGGGSSLVAEILSRAANQSVSSVTPVTKPSAKYDLSRSATFSSSKDDTKPDFSRRVNLKQCNVKLDSDNEQLRKTAAFLLPHSHSFSVPSQNQRIVEDSMKSVSFCHPQEISKHNLNTPAKHGLHHSGTCSDKDNLSSAEELNTSIPGFAKIRRIPSTVDKALDSMSRSTERCRYAKSTSLTSFSSPEEDSQCSESDSLLARVKSVDRLFTLILRTADMAEKTSQLTVKDLKSDIDLLKDKLKFQQDQSRDLETELSRKSGQLTTANSQIKELTTRVSRMTQSLLHFQDQSTEIARLQDDKSELGRKLRDSKGECTLLSGQLEEVIAKMDSIKSGQKPDGACVREIVALKKKNHELMMKLFNEKDKSKDLGEKAMRRIKILEKNWEKAETEVSRFDDLVEKVRQACIGSQSQSTHPALLQIVRLIDGREDRKSPSSIHATPTSARQELFKM